MQCLKCLSSKGSSSTGKDTKLKNNYNTIGAIMKI